MRIYIQDSDNLIKYNLSDKVEGSILFSYKSSINDMEISLNVDSENGKWIIKGNNNVIINEMGANVTSSILENYKILFLSIVGISTPVMLYCLPSVFLDEICYSINNCKVITVGSTQDNNIVCGNGLFSQKYAGIAISNGEGYISPLDNTRETFIYVNNVRIKGVTLLNVGDIIFINGIRIVWMKIFFRITADPTKVGIRGLLTYNISDNSKKNSDYTPVSEYDSSLPLYSNDQYFFHIPRIRSVPSSIEVKIDPPPIKANTDDEMPFILSIGSSLTMISMMFMYGINLYQGIIEKKDLLTLIPQIVMIFAMIVGSLLLPFFTKKWTKKHAKEKEEKLLKKYRDYLNEKENLLNVEKVKQEQIYNEEFPDLNKTLSIIANHTRSLWNREIIDDDFLKIRLGVGECDSLIKVSVPEMSFTPNDDELLKEVVSLKDKYSKLNNVPITAQFKLDIVTALVVNNSKKQEFINSIMLQLITYHSPSDLKIVIFTNEKNSKKWDYMKYIPHCWSDDCSVRYFANSMDDIKLLCQNLDNEYILRKESLSEKSKNDNSKTKRKEADLFDTFYLVICDDFLSVRDFKFVDDMLSSEYNYGFSMVVIEESLKNMPKECSKFIVVGDSDSGMFTNNISDENMVKFNADLAENVNMRNICINIAGVPIKRTDAESQLPPALSFLQMYNVGKIEQLNIHNRWVTSDPMSTLAAPIGVHANGDLFTLNLHEKYDGPHGLIAGSTGSGKSEFIITYILSMALNYDPKEVQFVLIDYKGGGLAGAFENRELNIAIPHLAGTITNLDTAEMNRTLVSIQSELKRRQSQFNKVKESIGESTMDIYKYQKLYREGLIKEPVSHLFIVSDEFAELKAQQPDFMDQLVSTARIGRSLGVHLILATQKPSGVVNDQIWSNSKFKVCLKVATKSDSMEMLKRPEAASIKETGRFYLQVGYDEYFDIGQSAWSGEKYIPVEHIIKKIDNSINFVGNTGIVLKSASDIIKSDASSEDRGDQLTNIVKYLCKLANDDGFVPKKLWLPSLEKIILLPDLLKKYKSDFSKDGLIAYVGEYDSPENQTQGLFKINLLDGNILIYGQPSSGKENLITTIVHSLCWYYSPDDISFYIGDFGAETLKMLSKYPHVGDVFLTDDSQRLTNMVKMLNKELERRKKDYSEFGGNYREYCKLSKNKDNVIVVCLNNFEVFQENYPRMSDIFSTLFRDGAKYGIVFIVSVAVSNAIRSREAQNFATKICMKMPDDYAYRDILGAPRGMVPVDNFGRGIYSIEGEEIHEFQTADICQRDWKTQYIREIGTKLKEKYPGKKAVCIPVLPDIAYVDDYMYELKDLSCVPIGVEINSLEVYVFDFLENKINLIAAKSIKNHIYFIYALIKQMLSLQNVNINIIDALSIYRGKYENVNLYNENLDEAFVKMYNNVVNDANQSSVNVYFIIGISSFTTNIMTKYGDKVSECFKKLQNCAHNISIFLDDSDLYKLVQTEEWFRESVNNTFGIWLGEDVSSQVALGIMSLGAEEKRINFPCIGYPVYQGNHMIIKYVVDGVDRKDEQ